MVLEGAAGQMAEAGDVDQRTVGITLSQLPAQQKTVPLFILQFHVQKINILPAVPKCAKKRSGAVCAAHNLHVIVLYQNFLFQYNLDLAAYDLIIVA